MSKAGVNFVLDEYRARFDDLIIIHGAAAGADTLASMWADRHCIPQMRFPADWRRHGKRAGPMRNQRMLDIGCPTEVVAFKENFDFNLASGGTEHMVKIALKAGLSVQVIMGSPHTFVNRRWLPLPKDCQEELW